MKYKQILPPLLCFLAVCGTSQGQVIINDNFDSYADVAALDVNWTRTSDPGGNTIGVASTGLNSTGALDYGGAGGDSSLVHKSSFSVAGASAETTFTMSGFFKFESTNNNGNAVPLFGFRDTGTGTMTDTNYLGGRVSSSSTLQFLNNGGRWTHWLGRELYGRELVLSPV